MTADPRLEAVAKVIHNAWALNCEGNCGLSKEDYDAAAAALACVDAQPSPQWLLDKIEALRIDRGWVVGGYTFEAGWNSAIDAVRSAVRREAGVET